MSTFLRGSGVSGMYLGSSKISEMYLGGNLFYSSGWPYETLRVSKDGGITWEDYGRPERVDVGQFNKAGITHVELPDSITRIGDSAFSNNNIEYLRIPDSVALIRYRAFYNNQLTHVEFSETLGSIGNGAFKNNPNLTEVRLSSRTTLTTGRLAPFDDHVNIIRYSPSPSGWPYKTFRVSKDGGATWEDYGRPVKVEALQFSYMGITHVELPDSVTEIGLYSFAGNEIESLYIPESVKTIEGVAFEENNLTYVEFPETLESIEDNAFSSNPDLTWVRISSRTSWVRDGHGRSFSWTTNISTYYPVWPYKTLRVSTDGGVTWEDYGRPTEVSDYQFMFGGVTHVEIPDSVTHIGEMSFMFSEIESLEIPESVKTIGGSAFEGNYLTHVYFPETLEFIGITAFDGNSDLDWVGISSRTTFEWSGSRADTFPYHTNITTY